MFLADFLDVDTSGPFSEHSYLEIETALLAGHPPDLTTVLAAQSASPEETASRTSAASMREGMWS